MSVTLVLEDELDISRGDLLAVGDRCDVGQPFRADVVWMDERPLDPGRVYLLKHTTRTVDRRSRPRRSVLNQIGVGDGHHRAAARLRSLRRATAPPAASS